MTNWRLFDGTVVLRGVTTEEEAERLLIQF